jgi:hypothetical protein
MLSLPETAEIARRVRAAMAYGDIGRPAAAAAMHVSTAQLDRFTGKKGKGELRRPELEQLWMLADECGLPRDFFLADLDRLTETVPDGLPRFGPRTPRAGDAPAPGPPGELGRRAETPPTTDADRERQQTRPGPDAASGSDR